MTVFSSGESAWISRLGTLRNAVRQELIAGQLADHVAPGQTVLDVGCGQGTQAVRLAARGSRVTAVDPSEPLLELLGGAAREAGVAIETRTGELADLDRLLGDRRFDVVCAHGLLMYLDDTDAALATLVNRVAADGLLSITFRNAFAMAFRPGMRQEWRAALAAFDAGTYVNELGMAATAHQLGDIEATLSRLGLQTRRWYGVRVFTDPAPAEAEVDPGTFDLVLQAEDAAGRRDPYRQFGSQLHLIAERS